MRTVPNWYEYFLGIAKATAARSKDGNTQVGAVLVSDDNRILSLGFNGMPDGVTETADRWESASKADYVVHAECNAIANAARAGVPTLNSWAVTTLAPCSGCSRMLIAAGVKKVTTCLQTISTRLEVRPELMDDYFLMRQLFAEAGVDYSEV